MLCITVVAISNAQTEVVDVMRWAQQLVLSGAALEVRTEPSTKLTRNGLPISAEIYIEPNLAILEQS